jgi:ankyrin repeat protein
MILKRAGLVVVAVWLAARLVGAAADTRLADAAEKTDWQKVRALVAARVAVDAPQADGMTALHWAVYHDNAAIADLLVRAHANVRAVNRYGVTPLSLACTNGNAAVVELLLKAGADPNVSLPGGETPLMTAARTGKIAAVLALLERSATVDAEGRTARTDGADVGRRGGARRRRPRAHRPRRGFQSPRALGPVAADVRGA